MEDTVSGCENNQNAMEHVYGYVTRIKMVLPIVMQIDPGYFILNAFQCIDCTFRVTEFVTTCCLSKRI